jgi:hypothetical protein
MPNEAGQSPQASTTSAATKPHYLTESAPSTNLLVGTSDLLLDEHQLGLHNAENTTTSISSAWPFNVSIS